MPASGSVSVRHLLPREKLIEAHVDVGEVYTTSLDADVSKGGMVSVRVFPR